MLTKILKEWWTGVPSLLALFGWTAQNYVTSTYFWTELPWDWFFYFTSTFFAGSFYADIRNPSSDIRTWWRKFRADYEIVWFEPVHAFIADGIETIQPTVKIRFTRDTNAAVYISSQIFLQGYYKPAFNEKVIDQKEYHQGQEIKIVLATIPKEAQKNAYFNAEDSERKNHHLLRNSRNIVTIKIGSTERKFLIEMFSPDSGNFGICYLLDENEDLWGENKLLKA
tara:strand:- start:402 stop:1076 length:675 start_codon:yes stop_codon:yes gene_type:complete